MSCKSCVDIEMKFAAAVINNFRTMGKRILSNPLKTTEPLYSD